MSIIEICYTACTLETQTVSPTLPGFHVIKLRIKYLSSHPTKHIFYPSNYYDVLNIIRLTWIEKQVE